VGVEAVGRAAVAEEGQAVGVEGGGSALLFEGHPQVLEGAPSGVAGDEGGGDDFARVIIDRQEEGRISVGGPPGMRLGVVLPEFADGGALPAATRLGTWGLRSGEAREVLADIIGDGGTGAMEVETPGQFVGQEGEVERLAVGQDVGQEIVSGLGPGSLVRAAGGLGSKVLRATEPLVAQFIEARAPDHQPLGGGSGVQLASVAGGEDFLDVERRNAVGELFLFIGAGA
jgi:hypothetical protein